MPKSRYILLTIALILFAPIPSVSANTDPQNSTPPATATVPVTTTTVSPGDTTAPTVPILVSPQDGSHSNDNTPDFVWTQSSDPNGNTVFYTFHLNGVATYLGISNIGNSAGNGYTARIDSGQVILTPTSGMSDGVYNWYVEAIDPSNNKARSTQWNLTIDTQAPSISITDISDHHELTLTSTRPEDFEGLNFDISGAGDIPFTIYTEPYATITLQITDASGTLVSQTTWPSDSSGLVYPHVTLLEGVYTVSISAYDQAAITTALPDFTITVATPQITVPLPDVPGLPEDINIPIKTPSFDSLPATISQVSSRLSSALLPLALLAAGILALLFAIWKRKSNIILTDLKGMPLTNTIVYHSIPTSRSPYSAVYTTKHAPISFTLADGDLGRLHIPRLSRYSTLTIKTQDSIHILSIARKSKLYTISL